MTRDELFKKLLALGLGWDVANAIYQFMIATYSGGDMDYIERAAGTQSLTALRQLVSTMEH